MIRTFSKIISYIFHPLLILTYMLLILLLVNPYLFGVNSVQGGTRLILLIFLSTFFLPGFAVVLMRALNMIDSLEMKDKMERIGPYIVTGIFYLWMFMNFVHNPDIPTAYTSFVLGSVIGLFIAFFINIFQKISVHAVGMGGLLAMVIITMLLFSYGNFTFSAGNYGIVHVSMTTVLMLTILLCGLVGSARLVLDAHVPEEIYGGFFVGFVAQFIALRFLF